VRDAGGELDHVDAALDLAERVGLGLAVFLAHHLGQLLAPGDHQFAHLEDDGGALRRGRRAPGLGGGLGVLHRLVDLRRRGVGQLRAHLARRRVEHVAEAAAVARDVLSADEMFQGLGHGVGAPRIVFIG
jgi:hypothetical protein